MNKNVKIILIVIGCIVLSIIVRFLIIMGFIFLIANSSEMEICEDVSKYNNYIGINAKENYRDKWGMDESIFPEEIIDETKVVDYKMVYYDQWDKQFLSYLVIDYDNEDYKKEIERLDNYKSTDYLGYYGVEGFSNYDLVAMYANPYNGFVYAITDNENRIIYVELIFCNYFYDLNYKEYIPSKYLPDGFDATINNSYQKKMMEEL